MAPVKFKADTGFETMGFACNTAALDLSMEKLLDHKPAVIADCFPYDSAIEAQHSTAHAHGQARWHRTAAIFEHPAILCNAESFDSAPAQMGEFAGEVDLALKGIVLV